MSLQTDIIFYKAIKADERIAAVTEGRIYNTAIPLPDEDADNVPLPYIIVSFDGMTNDQSTKDSSEGYSDNVQISVEVAATTRPQLAMLATQCRNAIRDYFANVNADDEDIELVPEDYAISAGPVNYDSMKPAYWQTLSYSCDTNV